MKTELAQWIQTEIRKATDAKSKRFWNNYLKNEIEFVGVGIPKIRAILKKEFKSLPTLASEILFKEGRKLMQSPIAEDKLAAIVLLELNLQRLESDQLLAWTESIFQDKLIFDWNTCDWLCVKLLTPLVDNGNKSTLQRILSWSEMKYLWHARAALVPFAQTKNLEKHVKQMNQHMITLIQRPERFSKTVVGWVLREISKFDKDFVVKFLNVQKSHLTSEIIDNSLKYASKEDRNHLKVKMKL